MWYNSKGVRECHASMEGQQGFFSEVWAQVTAGVIVLVIGAVAAVVFRRLKGSQLPPKQVTTSAANSPAQVAGNDSHQQITIDQSRQSFHGESRVVVQKVEQAATLNINYYEYVDGLPQAPDARVRRLFEEARQLHAKGEYGAAAEKFLECLSLEKDVKRRGALYIQVGNRCSEAGNPAQASEWYGLALADARKAGDREGEAVSLASTARTWVERPARDAPTKAENVRHALDLFSQALSIFNKDEHPFAHAMTQNNIAVAYGELPGTEQGRTTNLRKAVLSFGEALKVFVRTEFPVEHAMVQNNLGATYLDIPATAQERVQNVKNAVACFELASRLYQKDKHPVEYARAVSNLGEALRQLPAATAAERAANLRRAIQALQEAVNILRVTKQPFESAKTEVNLGSAYVDLLTTTSEEPLAKIQSAISCYERALETLTRDDYPAEYAKAQTSLGAAFAVLSSLVSADSGKNLVKAVDAYRQALSVISKRDYPSDYAMAQHNLGNAHLRLAALNPSTRAEAVRNAVACFREAITVYQKDSYPQYYCRTAGVLGMTLAQIGDTEACRWLREAWALREHLPVQHREAVEEMIARVCKE